MIVNRNTEYLYDTVAGSMDGLLDGSLVDLFRDIQRLRNIRIILEDTSHIVGMIGRYVIYLDRHVRMCCIIFELA